MMGGLAIDPADFAGFALAVMMVAVVAALYSGQRLTAVAEYLEGRPESLASDAYSAQGH